MTDEQEVLQKLRGQKSRQREQSNRIIARNDAKRVRRLEAEFHGRAPVTVKPVHKSKPDGGSK